MKISHSARPRNRSSRNSRSPPAGNEMAGTEAAAADAGSCVIASAGPASGGPAIRSAMDVIWHRLWNRLYALARHEDSIGLRVASKIPAWGGPARFRLELC